MSEDGSPFDDAEVVHRYMRREAIEDGVLIDLTEWARETGFVIPVACTAAVWQRYVVPDETLRGGGQSERGRGHDLLWMLWCAIRRDGGREDDQLAFDVIFLMPPCEQRVVRLTATCGPGDDLEPVLTILLPDED